MHIIMKYFVVVLSLSYVRSQRLPNYSGLNNVPILKLNYDSSPDGSYTYEYETGNGIAANEQGYVKNLGNPSAEAQVKQGQFTYTGPDNVRYTINYVADEDGFKASGAHIPTAPPIPDAILKSLAYNAAHPEQDNPAPGRRFFRK